ncbi:MAG: hypothetical protein LUC27_04880, partial [Lachnospiraceae bacterium]|nr:hypothetical protein [Lachnospiraceae bacterium]
REARADGGGGYFSTYQELMDVLANTESGISLYYTDSGDDFGWPSSETTVDLGTRGLYLGAEWEVPANVTITSGSSSWNLSNQLTLKGTLILTGYAQLGNICVENGGKLTGQAELSMWGTTLTVESGGTVCLDNSDWLFVQSDSIVKLQGTIETTGSGMVALRGETIQSTGGNIACYVNFAEEDSIITGSLTCSSGFGSYGEGARLLLDGTLSVGKRFWAGDFVVPSGKTLNLDVNTDDMLLALQSGSSLTVENGAVLNLTRAESVLYAWNSEDDEVTLTVNGTMNFNGNTLRMSAGTSLAGSGKLTGNGTVYLWGKQNSDGTYSTYSDVATISSDLKANRDSTVLLVIDGNNLASFATVTVASSKTYTGSAIKPTVKVTVGGTTLTKGTDYTVSYADNTNVGTATVTVTGKGDYNGTATATFKIKAQTTAKATVKSASYNSPEAHLGKGDRSQWVLCVPLPPLRPLN